ncbi:ISAs1 family transposase [Bernardetia sp. OM2101]|uniref:ISAs1 family transposase n=1 Tax=Bernardetia sp. OM2101 TaxID=3344876 RepID=UPI0035CE925A
MEFSDFIRNMEDSRRSQGQRYSFESMMWMIFLSIACGYESSRKMATFCISYQDVFIDYFDLKHGTPSYGTFHTFLSYLDSLSFAASFNTVMLSHSELEKGDWIAGDGQTLCSTVSSSHTSKQDYVSVVSLFCQKTGLSILLKDYMNKDKQESEAKIVLELLLKNLKDKGLMFTLDALHCQKKH